MTKEELITKVEGKVGFKSIVKDELAGDSPEVSESQKIEKRYFEVATVNGDGTAGITFVFYVYNTETEEAWFYNQEVEALDIKEPTVNQKKIEKIINHLDDNYDFVEVIAADEGKERVKARVNKFNTNGGSVESFVIGYKDSVTKEFKHETIE